jgi:hypothetical protein
VKDVATERLEVALSRESAEDLMREFRDFRNLALFCKSILACVIVFHLDIRRIIQKKHKSSISAITENILP